MKNLLIVLGLTVIVFACNTQRNDLSSLKEEVMLIHDDAMPRMGEVRSLQKKLLAMADSNASDTAMAQSYRDLANSLQLANESMMDWMRAYDPNFDGREDAVKEYLNRKKKEIEDVSYQMDSSINEAKKALGEE